MDSLDVYCRRHLLKSLMHVTACDYNDALLLYLFGHNMSAWSFTLLVFTADGFQISHYNSYSPAPIDTSWPPSTAPSIPNVAPFYPLPVNSTPSIIAPAWPSSSVGSLPITGQKPAALQSGDQAVLEIIDPMPFHINSGRNVFFSHNFTVASRERNDYCNGYVFTNRPLVPGEKLVISILSITNEYSGGLAFGMTSCNPNAVNKSNLPDDSDFLLDFPDYWVVHKDVCTKPEINDELTFHLTLSGRCRCSIFVFFSCFVRPVNIYKSWCRGKTYICWSSVFI